MDVDLLAGLWNIRSWRLRSPLLLAWLITALSVAIASPAQAHEPYVAKAWGDNHHGQLGDGSTSGPEMCGPESHACSTTPVAVGGLGGVNAVSAGQEFGLALLEDGTVRAWGFNFDGQLGDGTTEQRDVSVAVKELSGAKAIATGFNHGMALLESGSVMAWGQGSGGQLGDGSTASSDVPVAVCAVGEKAPCVKDLGGVKAIGGGEAHSLALLENGSVVAWGFNALGQLGNGTTANSDVPVSVTGLSEKKVKAIAAGEGFSLALFEDGTVAAWGNNTSGQLGNGTEMKSDVPVAVKGLAHVAAIAAGGAHALALLENGSVEAWGLNNSGQLGDGTNEGPETCGALPFTFACAKTPVAVHNLPGAVSVVAAGREHSLAVAEFGHVFGWGRNEQGRLGDGLSTGPEGCGIQGSCSKSPVRACAEGALKTICSEGGPFLTNVKGIAGGGEHSLALVPLPPSVASVTPNVGPKTGGTTVTITGAEFEGAEVRFGPNNATNVTVSENGTKITAVSPLGKGTVDVTVRTPAGTSPTSPADQFHYSPPTVKRVSPRRGPAAGGTSVTITGTNFAGATAVRFGASEATSFKVNSETSITAVSPAHASGTVPVTVTTPSGTSATSNPKTHRPVGQFKYR